MANENKKKYASLETLQIFKENADKLYATQIEVGKLSTDVANKADTSHTHTITNVTNLQTTLDTKVPTSRKVNGKALTADITLSASDVNAYSKTEIDNFEFITVDDIDAICGTTIQVATASEVTF